MRFLGQNEDQIDVRLGFEELILLQTALNEMCNGMQFTEDDFVTILGATRMEAETLLRRIDGVVERLGLDRG